MLWFATSTDFEADEPEGAAKSQYIGKKDLRTILLVILGVGIIFVPVYCVFMKGRDKTVCATYMSAIWKGMENYLIEYDTRYPPIYAETTDNRVQELTDPEGKKGVINWATFLPAYIPARMQFSCPSATPEETVPTYFTGYIEGKDRVLPLSYGMYAALSATPQGDIDLEETILISETSDHGALNTLNPNPLEPHDGFMIAWDNDNFAPEQGAEWMTRLAFKDTANAEFGEDKTARHDAGLNTIMASGRLMLLQPPQARVEYDARQQIRSPWATPAGFKTVR